MNKLLGIFILMTLIVCYSHPVGGWITNTSSYKLDKNPPILLYYNVSGAGSPIFNLYVTAIAADDIFIPTVYVFIYVDLYNITICDTMTTYRHKDNVSYWAYSFSLNKKAFQRTL